MFPFVPLPRFAYLVILVEDFYNPHLFKMISNDLKIVLIPAWCIRNKIPNRFDPIYRQCSIFQMII